MALEIPWAGGDSFDAQAGVRRLLEQVGIAASGQPGLRFHDEEPALRTGLHVGRAVASAAGAFGSVLGKIWSARSRLPPPPMSINIEHAELIAAGSMIARIGGRPALLDFISPRSLRQSMKMGLNKGRPFIGLAETSDGRWLHTHSGFDEKPLQNALRCSASSRSVAEAIGGRASDDLEEAIARGNGIAAVVRTPEEWAAHPQGQHLLGLPTVEIEKIGTGAPCPLPKLVPESTHSPLSGVRVLDLTRVLAGPACSRLLAEYGARCLKVTSPHLPFYPTFSKIENVGKRSAALDLRKPFDAQALAELCRTADVFVSSYRDGALAKRGFGPADVARLNPQGAVYVSVTCYGSGPWQRRGGFDTLAQAATGVSMAHTSAERGRNARQAPEFIPMSAPHDYITAYLGALGALVGLFRRHEEGGSYHVRVSLAQSAMWVLCFGYRQRTRAEGAWYDRFVPQLVDLHTYRAARPFLQDMATPFGRIQLIRSPVEFAPGTIERTFELPSVPFGRHPAQWWADAPARVEMTAGGRAGAVVNDEIRTGVN